MVRLQPNQFYIGQLGCGPILVHVTGVETRFVTRVQTHLCSPSDYGGITHLTKAEAYVEACKDQWIPISEDQYTCMVSLLVHRDR